MPNIFGIEGMYLNIINAIFNKSTINTLPLREKLKNSLISGGIMLTSIVFIYNSIRSSSRKTR